MKDLLRLPLHLTLAFCLLLFSMRPSVTGRMGPEDSHARLHPAPIGCLRAESAPKNAVHYRTSFGICEKKNLNRPMILACSVPDVFGGLHPSPQVFPVVVSTAAPSGNSPVLRI